MGALLLCVLPTLCRQLMVVVNRKKYSDRQGACLRHGMPLRHAQPYDPKKLGMEQAFSEKFMELCGRFAQVFRGVDYLDQNQQKFSVFTITTRTF
uniref:Uncharacterized protein n=1 Tax=Globodera rostochiensis TaxID=31243 RepID=A0A914HJX8_GLORO